MSNIKQSKQTEILKVNLFEAIFTLNENVLTKDQVDKLTECVWSIAQQEHGLFINVEFTADIVDGKVLPLELLLALKKNSDVKFDLDIKVFDKDGKVYVVKSYKKCCMYGFEGIDYFNYESTSLHKINIKFKFDEFSINGVTF